MRSLSSLPNRFILRLEQDQGHDRWIPLEDEDCIPDKKAHAFLVFLGKNPDPSKDEFFLTTNELEDLIKFRVAIDLAPAKGSLIETVMKVFSDLIIWRDCNKNRHTGISRGERGRYGQPVQGRNEQDVFEKILGLKSDKQPRNIER